jgi:NTE family protein
MKALVLSGGGNYGALQAGALGGLLSRGIRPDMVVGVSAGALNAAWVAAYPTLDGARRLARQWLEEAPQAFPPLASVTSLLRLARRKEGILSSQPLVEYIHRSGQGEKRFGEFAQPRLFVVAVRLSDGALKVFGDDPDERVIDGLMASTAVPPVFPPWSVDGTAYVDGGVLTNLPLQVAVERGADEIYALSIGPHSLDRFEGATIEGALGVGGKAVSLMLTQQVEREIEAVQARRGVQLHVIRLMAHPDPGFWNFANARSLIATGQRAVDDYFEALPERRSYRDRWQDLRERWREHGATPVRPALDVSMTGSLRTIVR